MAEENPEKMTDRRIIPKSTQREKARAAIEAILSTGNHQLNTPKSTIKPFTIEKNNLNAIPIKAIEPTMNTKIPDLDLDQKILADQRKLSATNRQRPGHKAEITKQRTIPSTDIKVAKPFKTQMLLGSDNLIIKQIVAKDIAKMYQKALSKKL